MPVMSARGVVGAVALVLLAGMPAPVQAQAAGAKRVSIAIMDFDYGTVDRWWGNADIGKGVADQIVEGFVEDGSFRVIERKKLDTVLAEQDFAQSDRADPSAAKLSKMGKALGVKYIVAGSITKFSTEQRSYGGGGLIGGKLGGLGLKKAKTEVALTARMIDTTTGEVVAVAKATGESKKGGGIGVGGAGGGGGAGFSTASSEFRESALGEAQEKACLQLVQAFIAKKERIQ
jgi:curli biogenesis system outer membrane secretion channel CsgG